MKSDLTGVKKGQTIWTIGEGFVEVEKIDAEDYYSIITETGRSYTLDGKVDRNEINPSAFVEYPFEVNPYHFLISLVVSLISLIISIAALIYNI